MGPADSIVRHLCHVWGIPLLAGPLEPDERDLAPSLVLETLVRAPDARLVMAGALWLSLLDVPALSLDAGSGADRRRTGYLCEIARCLGRIRGEPDSHRERSWPARVAGLEPAVWAGRIALFPSPAPPVPSSRFGDRWGIVEVLPFSDFAAFQRSYLDRRRGQEVDIGA